jgi:phosphoglycerate dehydrogenase-like enzyme
VHAGQWPKPAGRSLRSATLGIVGLGGIGRALAVRAAAAGMAVVGTDPSTHAAELASGLGVTVRSFVEVLAGSEFISVNCPLNSSTRHLFDAEAFGKIRRAPTSSTPGGAPSSRPTPSSMRWPRGGSPGRHST